MTSNLVKITLAAITMVGSVAVSCFTSKTTSKQEISEAAKSFKPIHIESRLVEINGDEAKFSYPEDTSSTSKTYLPRKFIKHIEFDRQFTFSPLVRVSWTAIDADNTTNLRILTFPTAINQKGFDLVIQTWSNTKIYFTSATWFSYEQISD